MIKASKLSLTKGELVTLYSAAKTTLDSYNEKSLKHKLARKIMQFKCGIDLVADLESAKNKVEDELKRLA